MVQHPFYGVRLFAEGGVIMVQDQDQVGNIDLAAGIYVGIGKGGTAMALYRKAYKTHFARIRSGNMTREQFEE